MGTTKKLSGKTMGYVILIGLVIVFRTKTIYAAIVTVIMQKEISSILIRKEFR